jgi:hypothetical protein
VFTHGEESPHSGEFPKLRSKDHENLGTMSPWTMRHLGHRACVSSLDCLSNSPRQNSFYNNFFTIVVLLGYIVAFTKILTIYQIYHTWIHSLQLISFIPPPSIPEIVSTGLIFSIYTHVCRVFTILQLSLPPSSPNGATLLTHTGPVLCVLWFCKRKKWHFCLFMIAQQGVSLWQFYEYMY